MKSLGVRVEQRVEINGADSEWIPVVHRVPKDVYWVHFCLFSKFTSEMFDLLEDRLFDYTDDSALLAVIGKPANRPAIAAGIWLGFTKGAIVDPCCGRTAKPRLYFVSRSRTVDPSYLGFLYMLVYTLISSVCGLIVSLSMSLRAWQCI